MAYLGEPLRKRADLARFVVHKIIWSNVFGRADKKGFVPLKAEYLRAFFPDSIVYSQVMKSLVGGGAIICDGQYIVGDKSYGYKLNPELAKMRQERVFVTDTRLMKKITRSRVEFSTSFEGVNRHLKDNLLTVMIDHSAALDLLRKNNFDPTNETAIQFIRYKEFHFHVCDYGRVHTNLTNLKARLRQFLSVRGESLVNLDVRNSQPLVFAVLLKDHYEFTDDTTHVPEDVLKYVELVQAGQFYDYLMEESGIPADERSRFKRSFFGRVFFCKNHPVTKEAEMFGDLFPSVYSVIRALKADDYTALAKALQRRESSIVIGGVATRCMRDLPHVFISTIHDSVLTTPPYADAIKGIMMDEFLNVGLVPTIRVEPA
jgi:hypothetical protein